MFLRLFLAACLLVAGATPVVAVESTPDLSVSEVYFDTTWVFQGSEYVPVFLQLPDNQLLTFSWVADASEYDGTITGYRAGWDVADPSDPNDTGWLQPGLDPAFTSAPARSFVSGVHTLTVVAVDSELGETRAHFMLFIQPVAGEQTSWSDVKTLFGN